MANLRYRIRSIVDSLRLPVEFWEKYEQSSNGLAVFVSILAAMLIWFMVSMRESYSISRVFPVEFVNMAPDTAFAEAPLQMVSVQLEGAGWQLLKLYTTSTTIRLDASKKTVDLYAAASQSLAPDLTPRSVAPAQATLALEARTTRRLPIRLSEEIETIPPFDLTRPVRLIPDSLDVSGAVSVVAQLEYWPTDVLKRSRVNRSFTTTVSLGDVTGGLVDRSIDEVTAFVDISEFTENGRMLDVRVTDAPDGQGRFRLIPHQVSVRYRVPIEQFEASAITDSFYAAVSYTDILRDTTGRVSPSIKLPAGIVVKDLKIETPRLQYYVVLD